MEGPLQILNGERDVSIAMRTPGNGAKLALGFSVYRGILRGASDVARIDCAETKPWPHCAGRGDRCRAAPMQFLHDLELWRVRQGFDRRPGIAERTIPSLPDKACEAQALFDRAGGLHAAALFSAEGELLAVREAVGRTTPWTSC